MRYDILEEVNDLSQACTAYNWVLHLPLYQLQYNSSFHKALGNYCFCIIHLLSQYPHIGMCPYKVLFGQEPNYNTDAMNVNASDSDEEEDSSIVDISDRDDSVGEIKEVNVRVQLT